MVSAVDLAEPAEADHADTQSVHAVPPQKIFERQFARHDDVAGGQSAIDRERQRR